MTDEALTAGAVARRLGVAVTTLRTTPTSVSEARLVAFDQATYDAIAAALRDSP